MNSPFSFLFISFFIVYDFVNWSSDRFHGTADLECFVGMRRKLHTNGIHSSGNIILPIAWHPRATPNTRILHAFTPLLLNELFFKQKTRRAMEAAEFCAREAKARRDRKPPGWKSKVQVILSTTNIFC